MKKKLLLVLTALLATASAWADDGDTFTANTAEGVEMTFKVISEAEKTCQVGDCSILFYIDGSITIPSTVNDYSVTSIGTGAFRGCLMSSITIPSSVTNIAK